MNEARVRRLVTDSELHATLAAHPKRRGARALRGLLASPEARLATESKAERLCLRLMIDHGLEPDEAGAWIGPYRVDFLFRPERLVVEVDGYRFHRGKRRFVADRKRRGELIARGFEVFPLTWHDLTREAQPSMARLRRARDARRVLLGLPAA